jgi:sugar phosphate isomerase/epimerase
MWEIGLSTGIGYQEPIETVLPAIRDHGFRTIEVVTARSHIDFRDKSRHQVVADEIRRLGLRAHSLHAPFGQGIDLTDADPAVRRLSLRRFREAADLLETIGGKLYVIHPGGEDHTWVWEREERLGRSVEGLTKVWELCRERDLTLVVETPLPHLLGGQLKDFEWILERLPRDGTGVCVDTSHTSLGGTLFEAIQRFAEHLVHIQASDNRGKHDDHFPPGEGIIEWPTVFKALERVGYEGVLLFEISGHGNPSESVRRVATAVSKFFPGWQDEASAEKRATLSEPGS